MTVIWILYVHSIQVRGTDNMKKTPLIKKHGSKVMAMMQATPQTRKKLAKDSPSEVIRCELECCQNVLKAMYIYHQLRRRSCIQAVNISDV